MFQKTSDSNAKEKGGQSSKDKTIINKDDGGSKSKTGVSKSKTGNKSRSSKSESIESRKKSVPFGICTVIFDSEIAHFEARIGLLLNRAD